MCVISNDETFPDIDQVCVLNCNWHVGLSNTCGKLYEDIKVMKYKTLINVCCNKSDSHSTCFYYLFCLWKQFLMSKEWILSKIKSKCKINALCIHHLNSWMLKWVMFKSANAFYDTLNVMTVTWCEWKFGEVISDNGNNQTTIHFWYQNSLTVL
jgi:hypothetical protein